MGAFKATILDKFTIDARWWDPKDSAEQRDGHLEFDAETGLKLSIFGRFPGPDKGNPVMPVIHGLGDGGRLTLFGSVEAAHKIQFPFTKSPNASSTVRSLYLIVGAHLEDQEAPSLEQMSVNFTDLEEWNVQQNFEVTTSPPASARAEHKPPPEIKIEIPGAGFAVVLDSFQGVDGDGIRASTLTHTAVFKIIPAQPQNLRWFLERVDSLRNMLATFYGHPAYPRMAFATRVAVAGENASESRFLQLYFGLGVRQAPKPSHWVYMTVTARDLGKALPSAVRNWFAKESYLRFLHEMLQDVKHNPRFPADFRFLAFAQGVESYHRQRYGTTYVPQEDYEKTVLPKLKSALPEDIDGDLRKAIATTLQYSNELSLRRRLKAILGDLPDGLRRLVTTDVPKWADAITNTRNYFTHRDPKSESTALKGDDLYDALLSLELLMTILLLREVEMPDDAIEKRMRDSFRFSMWIKNRGV